MSHVFTEYLQSLCAAGEPDSKSLAGLWDVLRDVLRREIRRRGLWESSPSFLGIFGRDRWYGSESRVSGGATAADRALDPLDELAADCYTFVFIQRLQCLRAQLRLKENIDGLVLRNIRNFLHDTQRRHDPLGYRVFVIAHGAVARLVQNERLWLLRGGDKIRNDSVFGFQQESEAIPSSGGALRQLVPTWSDELLPDLVTARGHQRQAVVSRLAELLAELPAGGVEVFRFKDLIDSLKFGARSRWAAWWQVSQGEIAYEDRGDDLAEVVRILQPDTGIEDRDSFRQLVACVDGRLQSVRAQRRTRDHLAKLWHFLQAFAAEHVAAERGAREHDAGGDPATVTARAGAADELPSFRALSQQLDIPRDRFRDLFGTLKEQLERCRESTSGIPILAQRELQLSTPAATEAASMSLHDLQESLGRRTAEALRHDLALDAEIADRASEPPRPGDVFTFVETSELAVNWAVLSSAMERRRWLVVPADVMPLIGSADVAVPAASPTGPLSLRCAFGLWLATERFDGRQRIGSIDLEIVERAAAKQQALTAAEPIGSAEEQEIDVDPEYLDWLDELAGARQSLTGEGLAGEGPAGESVAGEGHAGKSSTASIDRAERAPVSWQRRLSTPIALAASLLLALSMALTGGLIVERRENRDLRRQLEGLTESAVNLPFAWLESRQARGEMQDLVLPADTTAFLLVLSLPLGEPEGAEYRLDLFADGSEELVASYDALRRVAVSELTVLLRRASMPSGEYRLRLSRRGEAEQEIGTYGLRLSVE